MTAASMEPLIDISGILQALWEAQQKWHLASMEPLIDISGIIDAQPKQAMLGAASMEPLIDISGIRARRKYPIINDLEPHLRAPGGRRRVALSPWQLRSPESCVRQELAARERRAAH